ncbi:KICSTOR complex protein SZT2-like [Diachasmimorpha longicaudata]|uniref:KICSTOR complex protein SZT2-like n=1 Tax=Diachasmimorpha longicaudata TaxID=58733 RepID=UPI0030B8F413
MMYRPAGETDERPILEAGTVYLLMKKGFPISRNVRAQWILEHLDTVITIQTQRHDPDEAPELEVVSIIPKDHSSPWSDDTSHEYQYRITSSSSVIFLAHKYRMVFCLDLSPSLGTIDIQRGEVVMDEVYMAMKQCLENVSKSFTVPGTKRILRPEIYVTIIVHTPFFTNPAQQVLVQSWLITSENILYLMQFIEKRLNSLEENIARAEAERSSSGIFEDEISAMGMTLNSSHSLSNMSVISSEASFINMLRYGMLALALLPEHSCAHLVIVTDGIVGISDVYILDSMVQQLRASTIACSFLHVGSAYHPHCANGLVPYQDILCFLATATLGCYMTFMPQFSTNEDMNIYHRNFLCWQLYRTVPSEHSIKSNYWQTDNSLFYGFQPQLLRKKQIDNKVTCTLSSLLCCRLRDGYLIKRMSLRDGNIEICFILPWKTHVFLEYFISSAWPPKSVATCNTIQYTIAVEAPYEFLHDITCLSKKPLKSQYRQNVVSRFWATLSSLTENDTMLEHFSWFPEPGWTWYNVPDTIRSGMPVFYLPAYPLATAVQLSDAVCPQFGKIWKPVASLDSNQWARWMHSQRVTLVLTHDRPLPKYLHQANQSGRFQCIQCRQGAAVLYAMLKNWATFVLVENHTYVQFIYREPEKPPVSFSVIRINSKALCVVLHVAFAGGTQGVVRHNLVMDLVERLSKLTLPNRPTEMRETPCCTIIHKSLERILIRYERMPTDFNTVVFPDGTQPIVKCVQTPGGVLTTTLSRYLFHFRWLWNVKRPVIQTIPGITVPKLNITAIARILSTITKMRLNEGFNFAYSAAGIINMVLEVEMLGAMNEYHPCVIQYVIFPPHTISSPSMEKDSESEEESDEGTADGEAGNDDSENSGDYQIVTEVWVEPQCGRVKAGHATGAYTDGLSYHQFPDAICRIDEECINALLTLEHLSLLSQVEAREGSADPTNGYQYQNNLYNQGNRGPSRRTSINNFTQSKPFLDTPSRDDNIDHKLFNFDALSILPKCQQAELLFSMFADGPSFAEDNAENTNSILLENLMDHMKHLHNKEIILTASESQEFTEMLFSRPREVSTPLPFSQDLTEKQKNSIRWRCFINGISTTHIILTLLPSTEKDVRTLFNPSLRHRKYSREKSLEKLDKLSPSEEKAIPSWFGTPKKFEIESSISSRTTTTESTPKTDRRRRVPSGGPKSGLILPIYVYDCSLALLIEVLINKFNSPRSKDIYQNNTFSVGQHIHEDFIHLKSSNDCKSASPEPKSEDSDNGTDQRSLLEHCKLLNLAHCHCFVVAVYKSLSLQLQLSYEDMEAAVEQCEESLIEINITDYLKTVCKHLNPSSSLRQSEPESYTCSTCVEFQPLHNLIREKFKRIIQVAFKPVPAHPEFYYCSPLHNPDRQREYHRSDSDDDLAEGLACPSDIEWQFDGQIKTVSSNGTWPISNMRDDIKLFSYDSTESLISDLREDERNCNEQPLFLQLNCSVHSRSHFSSIPVKLLPTCFAELQQHLDDYTFSDFDNVKITLDIICLNLPKEVLEVSLERVALRTTSYCSASPVGSLKTESESSPGNDTALSEDLLLRERIAHLPHHQHNAISNLRMEIEWLLRDEIATALLDRTPATEETLDFVAKHVAESSGTTSCHLDKVPLQFVFSSSNSAPKFHEELIKMEVDRYKIKQLERFLYFVKDNKTVSEVETSCNETKLDINDEDRSTVELDDSDSPQDVSSRTSRQDSGDPPGCHSEISSIGEGHPGTDDGYEGDSSNSEDDCCWLVDLGKRRDSLPNFWLILQVHRNHVNVYFHCRFLEFASPEVDKYRQVQKMVVAQISAICKRVNQYLLLESLHDTRNCDSLLEPESHEDHNWRADSTSESGLIPKHESVMNMIPGMFRCSVVWEVPFSLHPRLKTGPGRSGLSRGIKALHVVLSRFSVNNRNNMFVYRENNSNVFYLRLHEQTGDGKPLQNKLSESDEKLMVSRSSSITSLSQSRNHGVQQDQSRIDDTRPRVRSFGEKDSDYLSKCEDSIVLMVHGISEPGVEVKQDLVQVLHNRLDDAVLEVLSVMLARNPMCKLTPADVHFIQKPYRSPESYVQFSIQPYYSSHMNALAYYLRQNVLQFLYIPKYTDPRRHYHFQDYSQPEGSSKRVPETDIFLNNQSQSSGNKGIACIAMAISKDMNEADCLLKFPGYLSPLDFKDVVSTNSYEGTSSCASPNSPIEFRIWRQGRVYLETLVEKLKAAIKYATWDLVVEYRLLPVPLTVFRGDEKHNLTDGLEGDSPRNESQSQRQMGLDELGEVGELHEIYYNTLPSWFQFALDMGVPSVKKHIVTIQHRHPIPTIVRELQNLIRINAPETSTRSFVLKQTQPFVIDHSIETSTRLPFTQDNDLDEGVSKDGDDKIVYVPYEFPQDEQRSFTKAVVVARNFKQWKASFSEYPDPEFLIPKDQKLLQKFNPMIQESTFIPRQRLLLAQVESNQVVIYMYNWSKERSEKLIKQVSSLATWLSSRSILFSSITLQKLGVFHHQPVDTYHHRDDHPQYQISDLESLAKFPLTAEGKEWPRRSGQLIKSVPQYSWDRMLGQVMRDARPTMQYPPNTPDPVVKGIYDLQDLYQRERKTKDDLTKLYTMWQSRSAAPSIPMPALTLQTFKQYSRLIHYCHTPILFLPQWRIQSAATRDHSLTPPSSISPITSQVSPIYKKLDKNSEKTVDSWHQALCASMLSEYKQYLQLLGFNPVQIDGDKGNSDDPHQVCYLKKSMLGGILVFEIHLSEPFFIVKLHIIECNRLQTKSNTGSVNQFMSSFVDACDKIKINMHLHSFTYDFHLRCIHSYIAGTGQWSLQQGYHLTQFLDDFIKYYSKAPNFARNLVYSDVVTVSSLTTPAHTLYSYLLSHEKTYGMQVFGMTSDSQDTRDSEYVLVRLQSTPLVSYCDAQDTKYTDDFIVALIVSKEDHSPQVEKTEISLKFYLILTSKRELYPKREVENNKLGKFRTVYSVVKTTTGAHVDNYLESGPTTPVPSSEKSLKDDSATDSEYTESNSDSVSSVRENSKNDQEDKREMAPTPPPVPTSPLMSASTGNTPESPHFMQIRQESVNYLGYYSSHEQLMQQLIISQAKAARQHITNMIERGTLHCRTHLLWNKLLENKSTMSYTEFMELRSLAKAESLSALDTRLSPLINQPIGWYQTLAKVLQNKYQEHHKQFSTPDGNVTHHLILHPSYLQAFMMLTIDLHTSRGELYAVYRKSAEITSSPFNLSEIHSLIEGFVNACCFHLWMGLCSQ